MEFVDTHCHLDDEAFATDLPQVVDLARKVGVRRLVNIGCEPEKWTHSVQLADRYPGISYVLGVHPNSADRWSKDLSAELARVIEQTPPVAIGETGLDYYWDSVERSIQRTAFRGQLLIARRFALPSVIHMRGAVEDDIVGILKDFPDVRSLFHSFDGSARLRDFALGRGDLIGVGGLMTRTNSTGLREILRSVPLESIVLETDSPYLTPKGMKGRRNTPASVPVIAAVLAELLGCSIDDVAEQTAQNAASVFGLAPAVITGSGK